MRILYLLKKEFIEIFRQKELLPLIVIAPIIQIIILGYVVTTDIKNIPVKIVNYSESSASHEIINRIQATPRFDVKKITSQSESNREELQRGDVKAIIIFRDSLKNKQVKFRYPEVQILMDGVDSNTSSIAAGYFNGIIKEYIISNLNKRGYNLPLESKPIIRFNPELRSINYMGPGIVALLLTILTLFITSVSIVREKRQQTMDTLLISKLTPLEIYIGKALPMAIIGLFNMTVGIFVVMLWFKIPVRGNLLYLFLSAVIFLAAILSYALLISTISNTQQQALFFSWFSMVTFILMSGVFTPVENIPEHLIWIADINPVRYLMEIIREIFLKGNGIEFFYRELIILGIIAVVVVGVSLVNYNRFIKK